MDFGTSTWKTLGGSAMIGVATGYLSQTGLATLVNVLPERTLPTFARSPWVRRGALALAGGEMIGNVYFTSAPSRSSPPLLMGRTVLGAAGATLLARSHGNSLALPILVGAAGGALGSKVSADSRAVLARHVPDQLVAWAENALALGLAVVATRR